MSGPQLQFTFSTVNATGSIKTNIGKEFLKLVDKHFLKTGVLKKILNRNTIKISYSCMSNLDAEISKHNHKTLEEYKNKDKLEKRNKLSNCRKKQIAH